MRGHMIQIIFVRTKTDNIRYFILEAKSDKSTTYVSELIYIQIFKRIFFLIDDLVIQNHFQL